MSEKRNVEVYVVIVTDMLGNTDHGIYNEHYDTVMLTGLRDINDDPVTFESDAQHVDKWAKDLGFKVAHSKHTIAVDLP